MQMRHEHAPPPLEYDENNRNGNEASRNLLNLLYAIQSFEPKVWRKASLFRHQFGNNWINWHQLHDFSREKGFFPRPEPTEISTLIWSMHYFRREMLRVERRKPKKRSFSRAGRTMQGNVEDPSRTSSNIVGSIKGDLAETPSSDVGSSSPSSLLTQKELPRKTQVWFITSS
jgi:hypothetical protein